MSSKDKTAASTGGDQKQSDSDKVTFKSRSPNFTLYLNSPKRHYGPHGEMEYRGEVRIKFINNHYTSSDAEVIHAMRKAKSFGTHFQEVTAPADAKSAA